MIHGKYHNSELYNPERLLDAIKRFVEDTFKNEKEKESDLDLVQRVVRYGMILSNSNLFLDCSKCLWNDIGKGYLQFKRTLDRIKKLSNISTSLSEAIAASIMIRNDFGLQLQQICKRAFIALGPDVADEIYKEFLEIDDSFDINSLRFNLIRFKMVE